MSHPTKTELPWYKSEAWLAVELAAFVPIALAFLLPASLRIPLYGAGMLVAVIGLGMLMFRKPSPRPTPTPGGFEYGAEVRQAE